MTFKLNYRAGLGLAALAAGVLMADLALAKDAPPIPSLPVALPTKNTGLPVPLAVADIVSPFFTIPTLMALTKGLV